ncbi:cortical protein KAR9-domain-containing protein [Fusarium tricinctum]|uniref:Cortical protein KAR9-domain-containing protein n=1 Tax=Fusarium tricinctum TaxID=61284 RepID=A0A8K0WGP5_9HYPO|nr:cortical protein KAR9-domain-containing protein [Fusarium tricinctum]
MDLSDLGTTTSAVKEDDDDSNWMSQADPFPSTPTASPELSRSAGGDQFASDNCDTDQDHDTPTASLLKFADVPGLPFNPGSANPSTRAPDPNSSSLTSSSSVIDTTTTYFDSPAANSSTTNTTPNASAAVTPAATTTKTPSSSTPTNTLLPFPTPTSPLPSSSLRKTSPGLAARLKALGFGSQKPSAQSTTPQNDRIGRLNEEQLRQLDEKHQAGSVKSIIARRGRPWKGAGASTSPKPVAHEPTIELPPYKVEDYESAVALLPEIQTPEPLEMDTQKYRLPDHTNGNGTKVTLDTRREHLERNTRPPSPQSADLPPPPPPKDTPAVASLSPTTSPTDYVPSLNSYFTPGHNRPGSIYTLSRASFASQLAQLTSLKLPDAKSLASQVNAIPTAQVAAKALINAAEQIRSWISKASEVVEGLDSEDDVEWAAAGGREGLAEVEMAITRFEELVKAYVGAIEQLQNRKDIANVSMQDLTRAVSQMESVIQEWGKIRRTLHIVRAQVEIAMEWEELWNNVLGDVQGEMDELSRLVFEMEERRHKSLMAASADTVDIGDLETIVEENPVHASRLQAPSRYSLPVFPVTPTSPGTPTLSQDDSSLLALFARMQPLRASLDFLPMRLSMFEARAQQSFPTACEELNMRREGLDASYKKLEKDAESLRKELGEDRWVIVFRGAGRQAQKMQESVERSLFKLREAADAGLHLTNQPVMMKKLESYEAKRMHYGPAIERVLSIIDKGVSERLTVNGEILRLHNDLQNRWQALKEQMKDAESLIEDIHADKSHQLRDSISSMLSNDRSTLGSGRETPGSSPPSSVIMSSLGLDPHTPMAKPPKVRATPGATNRQIPTNRRHSSLPAPTSQPGRKPGFSRLSTISASSSTTNLSASQIKRPDSKLANRPRWNASTNTADVDTGHNFKPLTLTTPSPYAKSPVAHRSAGSTTPNSGNSRLPTLRSPLGRASSASPRVDETPTRSGHSRLSFRERLSSSGTNTQPLPKPRLASHQSTTALSGRRSSLMASRSIGVDGDNRPSRPASSLATASRRISLLPQPRSETGRASPAAIAGARSAMRKPAEPKDSKPRWRH